MRSIVLWQDTLLAYGLAWFAALCVGAIALLTSVLLRSTAAAMGTMLAALIAGTILPRLAPVVGGAEVSLRDEPASAGLLLRVAASDHRD